MTANFHFFGILNRSMPRLCLQCVRRSVPGALHIVALCCTSFCVPPLGAQEVFTTSCCRTLTILVCIYSFWRLCVCVGFAAKELWHPPAEYSFSSGKCPLQLCGSWKPASSSLHTDHFVFPPWDADSYWSNQAVAWHVFTKGCRNFSSSS